MLCSGFPGAKQRAKHSMREWKDRVSLAGVASLWKQILRRLGTRVRVRARGTAPGDQTRAGRAASERARVSAKARDFTALHFRPIAPL